MGLPVNVTLGLDKLVETVANATGLTALGTIMNAKGEAKAEAILAKKRAETNAEVEILRQQGEEKVAQYVLARNNQKVENVGAIISKAQQQFAPEEEVSSEPVDKDWMSRFLDIAETISDDEMRDLWARVLAGEVKNPKSYSLRTLEVLRNITKEEAEIIVKASSFVLDQVFLCIEKFALNLQDKICLDEIGIICGEDLIKEYSFLSEKMSYTLNRYVRLNMYAPVGTKVKVKCIKLTKAGVEIINIIQKVDYNAYITSLSSKLKQQGVTKVTINPIISWISPSSYNIITQEIEYK